MLTTRRITAIGPIGPAVLFAGRQSQDRILDALTSLRYVSLRLASVEPDSTSTLRQAAAELRRLLITPKELPR